MMKNMMPDCKYRQRRPRLLKPVSLRILQQLLRPGQPVHSADIHLQAFLKYRLNEKAGPSECQGLHLLRILSLVHR